MILKANGKLRSVNTVNFTVLSIRWSFELAKMLEKAAHSEQSAD